MEQAQPLELRKSRGFGDQINVTFSFMRENFKNLGKSVLFIVGPTALVAGALIGYFFLDILALSRASSGASRILESGVSIAVGGIFAFISTILLWAVVVDYVRLYLDRSGPNFTTAELWTEVKGDLGRVFATAFGLGLIVAAVYLIVIVVALLRSEFLIVLAVLAVLGVFFYMYVPLSLIFTVRLCEDDGFWASISRCFELVKGNWWKTFGVFIVLNTIVNVVSGIFLFPAQMFMYLIEFGAVESGSGGMKLVITILLMVGMVAAYLLAAVPALGATLQYFNLVEKHESVGLMGRIESMGDATANDNTF